MAQKAERFRVVAHGQGVQVTDSARGGVPVAWCRDSTLTVASGSWSIDGRAEAQRIARLLNDAEAAKRGR